MAHCTELPAYSEKNKGALVNYGQHYRVAEPISSLRAEGRVNHLVNARMNKRRQMRWLPQGPHRMLRFRLRCWKGVLDRRQPSSRRNRPKFLTLPGSARVFRNAPVCRTDGGSHGLASMLLTVAIRLNGRLSRHCS